ncbi:MAG: MBL fold metallo-hydrolase [Bacteroidales bacterium]|nr:MBL fold metallo-hydrolase [Bacteroidales bacterium]
MIELCALASGSNGNCYYIGNRHEAVLIDAGISAKRIISRMHQKNLDPAKIIAVFISHEHSDHTSGTRVLSKKLKIPFYLTAKTYAAMYSAHRPDAPRFFVPGARVNAGSFIIHTFPKNHDAVEPCSFRIEYSGIHTGVFTDIGSFSEQVVLHLNKCHAVFLETNYDERMLQEGTYPWPLKKRIASEQGHLSNDQAFELLASHSGCQLKTVFLSHLSAENNTPDVAMSRFMDIAERFRIHFTSRTAPSEVVILS